MADPNLSASTLRPGAVSAESEDVRMAQAIEEYFAQLDPQDAFGDIPQEDRFVRDPWFGVPWTTKQQYTKPLSERLGSLPAYATGMPKKMLEDPYYMGPPLAAGHRRWRDAPTAKEPAKEEKTAPLSEEDKIMRPPGSWVENTKRLTEMNPNDWSFERHTDYPFTPYRDAGSRLINPLSRATDLLFYGQTDRQPYIARRSSADAIVDAQAHWLQGRYEQGPPPAFDAPAGAERQRIPYSLDQLMPSPRPKDEAPRQMPPGWGLDPWGVPVALGQTESSRRDINESRQGSPRNWEPGPGGFDERLGHMYWYPKNYMAEAGADALSPYWGSADATPLRSYSQYQAHTPWYIRKLQEMGIGANEVPPHWFEPTPRADLPPHYPADTRLQEQQ